MCEEKYKLSDRQALKYNNYAREERQTTGRYMERKVEGVEDRDTDLNKESEIRGI